MAGGAVQRVVVAVLEGVGCRLWGFPPRLMGPIVSQLGPLRALGWFMANMPRYERTRKAWGGLRTHLLCVGISLVNGCRYCTFGHAHALELIYLQQRGELFPLDEAQIGALVGCPPVVIRRRLVTALEQAGLHREVRVLDRTLALLVGAEQPAEPDELRIAHLVGMFAVLNSVGVAAQTAPDQAHDPVNKDVGLKTRYARLRAASGM